MDRVYPNLEKISIDFAVMENGRVVMLESNFDWDDVRNTCDSQALLR